ncbi:hypothetical protein DUI87_21165 [Hirundo rustica rustica]|uniref:Histidine-rich glycoprotein n=1 Tax=Hirundo rustica rustica TaxID=333673 RepID=A0A3M0JM35_HIRRU|nr:hypothetical protein DUI87_21165 [Hirundo rustica rustica]
MGEALLPAQVTELCLVVTPPWVSNPPAEGREQSAHSSCAPKKPGISCSKAQVTPADCNTIETDAGVALDLVNRHRRDGYVFGLFRVADAHELHLGNSTVLYLTLDVLETECSVLSRRHWESCEYSDTYPMAIPPDLVECKDCPVKLEALEVTEKHKDIAKKALKKFNSEDNHTNNFAVDKVEKILKMHTGFCKARIISDADEAEGTDISCEIYHPWVSTQLWTHLWLYPHAGYSNLA